MRFLAVVVVVLGSAAPARAERGRDEIERARETAITDDLQTGVCLGDECERAGGTGRGQIGYGRGREQGSGTEEPVGSAATREGERMEERFEEVRPTSVARTIMWGLVIVAGAVLVFWLVNNLRRSSADPVVAGPHVAAAPVAAALARPLDDAEELARRGAFGEAIHTLLLRTLQELARGADVRIVPAMTSREILARVPLAPAARAALGGLVATVELTHFGEAPAGALDYERCRGQFHAFLRACGEAA